MICAAIPLSMLLALGPRFDAVFAIAIVGWTIVGTAGVAWLGLLCLGVRALWRRTHGPRYVVAQRGTAADAGSRR